MNKAGIAVRHYRGRYYWTGPAVITNEDQGPSLQAVYRATKVITQRDNCARDWVVYPVEPGTLLDQEEEQ